MRKLINYLVEAAFSNTSDEYPHNPRGLEWLLSFVLVFTGIGAILFDTIDGIIPLYLIISCIVIGASRIGALIVNGNWKRSPVLRLVGALLGGFVWATFTVTFMQSAETLFLANTVYPLFVWAELYSCSRSARDMIVANAEFHGENRDESAIYPS